MILTHRVLTPAEIAAEFEHWPSNEIAAGRIWVKPDHMAIARANRALGDPHWRDLPGKPLTDAQASCLGGDP